MDSQVVLVAVDLTDAELAAIEAELDKQAKALSRVDIVRESIAKSNIVRVKTVAEALQFSNDYAPEHLIIHLQDAKAAVPLVENAGSVFVGPYSPERYGVTSMTTLLLRADSPPAAVATTPRARTTRFLRTATHGNSAA